jgi:hypothetical protein
MPERVPKAPVQLTVHSIPNLHVDFNKEHCQARLWLFHCMLFSTSIASNTGKQSHEYGSFPPRNQLDRTLVDETLVDL